MIIDDFLGLYRRRPEVQRMATALNAPQITRMLIQGCVASSKAVVAAATIQETGPSHLFLMPDKTEAAYFHNDLEKLLGEHGLDYDQRSVLLFPASARDPYDVENTDNANVLMRSEVLHRLESQNKKAIVVSYPEAIYEKVVTKQYLQKQKVKLSIGHTINPDVLIDLLDEQVFERVDFVCDPGQYAVRGCIIDVFSYSGDYPYRIEWFGDIIESIRSFDPVNQLSRQKLKEVVLLPNVQKATQIDKRTTVLEHLSAQTVIWVQDLPEILDHCQKGFEKAQSIFSSLESIVKRSKPEELYADANTLKQEIEAFSLVEWGPASLMKPELVETFQTAPQPAINKQFNILVDTLLDYSDRAYTNLILSDNTKQIQRLERIFFELGSAQRPVRIVPLNLTLHQGYVDHDLKLTSFTDHQIFERYHRASVHRQVHHREAITLKSLYELKPGDFVTHIDHGVGRFSGLEKIDVGGHQQETIRLVYKENDVLYVSIHSLHKISKYSGKEGAEPTLTRLGSATWTALKHKTKQRVQDIAKDLIQLYAQRKASKGFAFSPDAYLQHELEASFFYEDTPDQLKATQDVKHDMEDQCPMDRLICGDVGFGKTEIAIRAAFKSVCDGKQVAVLVPTTILAFQHFKTFTERLKDMPCRVDYINRFRSTKDKTKIMKDLASGQIDILIGTHRMLNNDFAFKDLGLLIIDEEQKFGVSMKEKLKRFKVDVDTLALSATPIPRTLQFSLMGARDMSIISTPPPNRYPVYTAIHSFDESVIRDAIVHELARGGQVFFVHSRIQNIFEIAAIVQKLVPDASIAVAHGQMDGAKLEEIMMDFIDGLTDVLISTKIVENGLDIPNANTIIINEAQAYGLSELHQLRGRVGRSNRKSYCYLIAPPAYMLSDEAKKRLKAIEEFSEIGSGFNIAMRDLDIRGAGNVLGAEQSGFISDIGFDMYHQILDEAIRELKENEFKDLYETPVVDSILPKECQLETDLEILIPDYYVSSTVERITLYKELDTLIDDADIDRFAGDLLDRFGPLPDAVQALLSALRLRREARIRGVERLVIRRNQLTATFTQRPDYFQSPMFGSVLSFVQANPKRCVLKETNDKLTLSVEKVAHVQTALDLLAQIPLSESPEKLNESV